jgi:hypothetical protein
MAASDPQGVIMEQQQEGERSAAFLADAPRAWYDDNGGLWAILAFTHIADKKKFLAEVRADAVCGGELAALEEVLETQASEADVGWLWVCAAGDGWYNWCAGDDPGALAVTALPGAC